MKTDTEWGYVGEEGPTHWADLSNEFCACGGDRQSPIDLPVHAAAEETLALSIDYTKADGTLSYSSYGVKMQLKGGTLTLDGTTYELVQFHFHTPSEHQIGGRSFPGEMHLVHVSESGHLVVIGIFLENGKTNSTLAPIWSTFPEVETAPPIPFDPSDLLPPSRTGYVYEGSLTTPPCTEDVTWLVLSEPLYLSDVQIEKLAAVHAEINVHNSRPVQPVNDRHVRFVSLHPAPRLA
ncbi:carbonic anhydrase [Longibacter salinarum]|nr:carbonic anhydrase family protein [Longibacter salinarum]